MPNSVVSTCHSLELLPVSKVRRFARAGWTVKVTIEEEPAAAPVEIPGTVLVSATPDIVFIAKKITFRSSDLDASTAAMLNTLRGCRLIALYTDERGRRRVCGSLNHPLTLNFSESGGIYEVTLEGRDLFSDPCLAK